MSFQSTLPVGGATAIMPRVFSASSYFNPRSPWGATRPGRLVVHIERISIHAPRGGSDCTIKACSNDRIKRSTLREPHFLYSKDACFSPIFPLFAATSRTKKSENQSFIRIISRLGAYVLHLRLVSIAQIVESNTIRRLVHQHFQRGTK